MSAVVVDDGGRILLGRRADTGSRSLPAGAIDPGEQPADAAVREVFEEAGVRIAVDRLAGVALREVAYPHGDVCQYLMVWFRCRAIGGHAVVKDEESSAVGWHSPDELPDLDAFEQLRIGTALDDDAPTWFSVPGQAAQASRYPRVYRRIPPDAPTGPALVVDSPPGLDRDVGLTAGEHQFRGDGGW